MKHSPALKQLAGYGSAAAVALIILTLAWIMLLALAPAQSPGAATDERIAFLADHEGWHVANFAVVAPMGLVHVPLWLGLGALVWSRRPALAAMTVAFGLLYAPFTVMGYWSQLTTVRGIVALAEQDPAAALTTFDVLAFSGELWSFSYGVIVLGYGVWGIAALSFFAAAFGVADRLTRVCSVLFGVSGMFGVVGAIGFAAENAMLELGVIFSGIVFLPALVAAAVVLRQASTGRLDNALSSSEHHEKSLDSNLPAP
jgi:hypothetical protein